MVAFDGHTGGERLLGEPLAKVVAENRLGEIKGTGEALEKKITKLVMGGYHPAE